jgi:tricorn protease
MVFKTGSFRCRLRKGRYKSLSVVKEGELFYLSVAPHESGPTMLNLYSLKKRKEEAIMPADGIPHRCQG